MINFLRALSINSAILLILGCGPTMANPQAVSEPIPTQKSGGTPIAYCSKDGGTTWMPFSDGLPEGETVHGFALSGDTAWAATNSHGVFRKIGNGTWVQHGILPDNVKVSAIIKTEVGMLIGTFAHGIQLMENGTDSWQKVSPDFMKTPVRGLMAHEDKIFAATNSGIFASSDGGHNWAHFFGDFQFNGFAAVGTKIYAAAMNGAYLSVDGGEWRKIYATHTLHDIAVNGQRIFAMTLGENLLSSDDDGKNWENANTGLETSRYTFEIKKFGNRLFLGHWAGIFYSDDGGRNWLSQEGGLPANTAFPVIETSESLLVAAIGLRN